MQTVLSLELMEGCILVAAELTWLFYPGGLGRMCVNVFDSHDLF